MAQRGGGRKGGGPNPEKWRPKRWEPKKWGPRKGGGPKGLGARRGGGPKGWGPEGVGGRTQKKWGPSGGGPEGWGPKGGGGPKFRAFFPLSHRKFHSLFSLWGVSRGILVVFEAPGPEMCAFRVLWLSCEPRRPGLVGAAGVPHDNQRAPTCTFQGPCASKTPPKFNEKTSQREEKEGNFRREREKKERNFGRSRGRAFRRREVRGRGPEHTHHTHNNHQQPPTTTNRHQQPPTGTNRHQQAPRGTNQEQQQQQATTTTTTTTTSNNQEQQQQPGKTTTTTSNNNQEQTTTKTMTTTTENLAKELKHQNWPNAVWPNAVWPNAGMTTRSKAIILQGTLPAYCIPKVERLKTGEVLHEKSHMSPRPPPKISLRHDHDWTRGNDKLGSTVDQQSEGKVIRQSRREVQHATFSQLTQPNPKPICDRSGKPDNTKNRSMKKVFTENSVLQIDQGNLIICLETPMLSKLTMDQGNLMSETAQVHTQ